MRKSSNIFTQKARKNGNPRTRSSPEDQSDTTCVKNDPYNTIMHPPRSHYSTFRSLSVNDAGKHAKRSTGSHVSGQKAERGKEAAQRPFGKLNGTSRKQENTRAIIHFDQATCGQPVSAFVGGQVERKRPGKSDQAARGQGRPDGASAEPRQRRGFHASRSAVRRYALYRGMLRTPAKDFTKTNADSDRGLSCTANQRRESGPTPEVTSPGQPTAGVSPPAETDLPLIIDEDEPLTDYTRGFDLKGTTFPKRIYIRECVNDAIVDELVVVRNQEEWDLLTYMAPLRPITGNKTKGPGDLRFQDLRDFDVYHYPFDWRGLRH